MNRLLVIIIIACIAFQQPGFAQKKEKKRHRKDADKTALAVDRQDVTNTFIDATKARLTGDIATATSLYKSCLQKDPAHAPSMYELAQIYSDANEHQSAIEMAAKAVELEPANKWYKLLLVELYGKAGKKDELLKICQQLVKEEPANAEYLYELANAYLLKSDGTNAIKTYNQVESLIGPNEEISLQKYKIYLFQKKTDDAVAEIEKLAAEFPEQASRYNSMIAETYMEAGDTDKAYAYYQKILQTDPSNPYIHITLSDYYRKKGDQQKAVDEIKLGFANPDLDVDTKLRVLLSYYSADDMYNKHRLTVAELASILVKTHPASPKAHSLYGDMLYNDKKYAQAIDEYRKVLESDSSRYAVWESLMNAHLQLGDYASLLSESKVVTELFPMQPVPYLFKGAALLNEKQFEEALDNFTTGMKMVSGNNALLTQFYIYLADTYHQMKEYRLSDENYENALKLDPDNSFVLNNYAYYLSVRGENLEKAETMSAKSLKLDPENTANMDTYGWVLYKLGRYSEALKYVEKAISLSPKADADVLEHLGDIYFRLGDTTKAVKLWQDALNSGSGSELLPKKVKDSKLYE